MEALLRQAEAEAAVAERRLSRIRGLVSAKDLPRDVRDAWNTLWAVFRCCGGCGANVDPNVALGVCFNLLLVHRRLRPGFLIMRCEEATPSYARALAVASTHHFAIVCCAVGSIVCLPSERERVAERLARGAAEGKLDTAVGQVLGYCYAGELREFHQHADGPCRAVGGGRQRDRGSQRCAQPAPPLPPELA